MDDLKDARSGVVTARTYWWVVGTAVFWITLLYIFTQTYNIPVAI